MNDSEIVDDIILDPEYGEERRLSDELMEIIMNGGAKDLYTAVNTMVISEPNQSPVNPSPSFTDGSISGTGNTTVAPKDASELIYTLILINDFNGWDFVDSGAKTLFVATDFVVKH